jgi:hypothetical protein
MTLLELNIRGGEDIHNMDESGARVGCLRGEEVVVPIEIKKLYTSSPKNRKSDNHRGYFCRRTKATTTANVLE